MYRAFSSTSQFDPIFGTLPGFFAKLSLIWPASYTILAHAEIRTKLFCRKKKPVENNEVTKKFMVRKT